MKLELFKAKDFNTFISAINKETAANDANRRINEILEQVLKKDNKTTKEIIKELEKLSCD